MYLKCQNSKKVVILTQYYCYFRKPQCYIDSINSVKLTITYYVKIANITSAKTTCTKLDINPNIAVRVFRVRSCETAG